MVTCLMVWSVIPCLMFLSLFQAPFGEGLGFLFFGLEALCVLAHGKDLDVLYKRMQTITCKKLEFLM